MHSLTHARTEAYLITILLIVQPVGVARGGGKEKQDSKPQRERESERERETEPEPALQRGRARTLNKITGDTRGNSRPQEEQRYRQSCHSQRVFLSVSVCVCVRERERAQCVSTVLLRPWQPWRQSQAPSPG